VTCYVISLIAVLYIISTYNIREDLVWVQTACTHYYIKDTQTYVSLI